MSGDLGPRSVIPAVLDFARRRSDTCFILCGDEQQLSPLLASVPEDLSARLSLVHAPRIVAMDEDPRSALRHKRESSMWCAVEQVRTGAAQACVSAGNTGALMAMGRYLLKTLPGIERPAICKAMPVESGLTYMLDLGANITATPEQLHQFALLGSALAEARVELPRVALLNIGVEEGKGTDAIRAAHQLLRADERLHYIGFLEADAIFSGAAEVIVCDGFTGNIALKASEGVAHRIAQKIVTDIRSRWRYRLLGFWLRPLGRQWLRELGPGLYNGAIFLGLRQTLVKSHGSADAAAFAQAIEVAREQVKLKEQ